MPANALRNDRPQQSPESSHHQRRRNWVIPGGINERMKSCHICLFSTETRLPLRTTTSFSFKVFRLWFGHCTGGPGSLHYNVHHFVGLQHQFHRNMCIAPCQLLSVDRAVNQVGLGPATGKWLLPPSKRSCPHRSCRRSRRCFCHHCLLGIR